jgi:hypothetical protein
MRLGKRLIPVFAVFLLVACSAPSMDESDLRQVVEYFYHPGGKKGPSPEKLYAFLSAETRKHVGLQQWEKIQAAQTAQYDTAAVLKTETVRGTTYGIVSLVETTNGARTVSTTVWVSEENKWRRLKLTNKADELTRAFDDRDFKKAKTLVEEWLAADPFSLEVHEALLICLDASGPQGLQPGRRTAADVLRTMLAINPEDTRALFDAAVRSADSADARRFLVKLAGTPAYAAAVEKIAARAAMNEDKGRFTADENLWYDELLIQKLLLEAELGDFDGFKRLTADPEAIKRLTRHFEHYAPADVADRAGRLGIAQYKSGDAAGAAKWLDLGVAAGRTSKSLASLKALLAVKGS